MCFKYDKDKFPNKKEFLLGYPVIKLEGANPQGDVNFFNWYPSEYLYLEGDHKKYCLAADYEGRQQILIGSTMMRQHDFIFDIDNDKLGVARSRCNDEVNMITTEMDYVKYGTTYGIDVDKAMKQQEFVRNNTSEEMADFMSDSSHDKAEFEPSDCMRHGQCYNMRLQKCSASDDWTLHGLWPQWAEKCT